MAKFITLTKVDSSGTPVFINSQEIQYFFTNEKYTKVVFSSHNDNSVVLVKETPEQIVSLLKGDETNNSLPQGNFVDAMRGNI